MTQDATDIANDILAVGMTATLIRLVTNAASITVTVAAVARSYTIQELTGIIAQGDREVRISNREILAASWPGPPKRGDQITLASRACQIMGVETKHIINEAVMHVLQVRG